MKIFLPVFIAFLLGILAASTVTLVLAHGGNTNYIHACVGTGVINQGRMRIITPTGTCNANETPLDWQQFPKPGTDFPLILTGNFGESGNTFVGKNFSNALISDTTFNDTNFSGSNFSESTFDSSSFINVNFSNVNISNAVRFGVGVVNSNFTGVNAQNVSWQASEIINSNFSNSNFQNVTFQPYVIITDSNFTGANFTGANTSGIQIWNNTISRRN